MADQNDVKQAVVALIGNVIYPNGTGQAPAQGVPAVCMYGWPIPAEFDQLMAAGTACIWVYSLPEVREKTRYPYVWQTQTIVAPSITAVVSNGNRVTIGGSIPSPFSPHNVFVFLAGVAFGYAVQPNDTLTSIATALAIQINAIFPGTTNTGPVITTGGGGLPTTRVGTTGNSSIEVGRFEQAMQIMIATSNPSDRYALSNAILPALMSTSWLYLPDGTSARIITRVPVDNDMAQKVEVYRRDIKITAEYAVTQVQNTATVEAVITNVNSNLKAY